MKTIYPNNHFFPPFSHIFVWIFVISTVLLLVFAIRELLRAMRKARAAKALRNQSPMIREGEIILRGIAKPAPGKRRLVRVEITQEGTEQKGKHGWSHTWRESGREFESHPFYLDVESGEHIRVEPGPRPYLVDAVDDGHNKSNSRRILVSELTENEPVTIEGRLERGIDPDNPAGDGQATGYRANATCWILKAAHGRLHISTEPLEKRHQLRARAFRWRIFWSLLLLAGGSLCTVDYFFRQFWGVTVKADVMRTYTYTTRSSKGGTTRHYKLNYQLIDAPPHTRVNGSYKLDDSDFEEVAAGDKIWVRVVPHEAHADAGGYGTSINLIAMIAAYIFFFVAFGLIVTAHDYRRWYDGRLTHTGSERLPGKLPFG